MRVGFNPNKDKPIVQNNYNHQVIIPVHIPNQEGYFKDSFQIFKYCLESLFTTSHSKTYFTIVNNGSCKEVISYLNELLEQEKVQEVIHTTAIGKLNAVLKGISGQDFKLITITDADVLFLNGWQKASYEVFKNFPKTGAVCTTPSPRSLRTYTANVYWDTLFSKQLKVTTVPQPQDLQKFAESVGNPFFYNKYHLKQITTVFKDNCHAVVGAGHFSCTYRAEVFENLTQRFTKFSLGGNSEGDFLDIPVIQAGLWRLSTFENYTYHLGNTIEPWMLPALNKLDENSEENVVLELAKVKKTSFWIYCIKNKLFAKIILNKKILIRLLILKGLDKEAKEEYLV